MTGTVGGVAGPQVNLLLVKMAPSPYSFASREPTTGGRARERSALAQCDRKSAREAAFAMPERGRHRRRRRSSLPERHH